MGDIQMTVTVAKVLRAFLEDMTAPRYGVEIIKAIGLPSGTVYPVLARLERAGWLTSEREAIDPVSEGRPPRRYYTLNPAAASRAHNEVAALANQLHLDRTGPKGNLRGGLAPGPIAGLI